MRRSNPARWHWFAWSAAMGCLILPSCSNAPTAEPESSLAEQRVEIEAAPAQRTRISATLETVGTLLPIRATTIVAEIDGIIKRLADSQHAFEFQEGGQQQAVVLGLDIGSMVQPGEILVELDPTDARLDLERSEARLRLAESRLEELQSWKRQEEVEQARAKVDECQAGWQLATEELGRVRRLIDTNATSRSQLDMAEAAERQALATLAQARAALNLATEGPTKEQLAVARAEVSAAEVEVRQRQRDLEKTVIRSPYSAVVTDRFVDIGDRVTAMPRVEIMQIVDPRVLFAEIDVPERFIGRIQEHDSADVAAESGVQAISGRVELINGRIDPETRTFRVRIGVDNRDGRLKPGGLAR
ncbi:MAG: efflux RND transporter periplasmic adaptor subunit, partial [Planctomycetes bacterium]|nr:efflux RND transporter periplasmic adaptor subunit [Planctomycetota bacterium]